MSSVRQSLRLAESGIPKMREDSTQFETEDERGNLPLGMRSPHNPHKSSCRGHSAGDKNDSPYTNSNTSEEESSDDEPPRPAPTRATRTKGGSGAPRKRKTGDVEDGNEENGTPTKAVKVSSAKTAVQGSQTQSQRAQNAQPQQRQPQHPQPQQPQPQHPQPQHPQPQHPQPQNPQAQRLQAQRAGAQRPQAQNAPTQDRAVERNEPTRHRYVFIAFQDRAQGSRGQITEAENLVRQIPSYAAKIDEQLQIVRTPLPEPETPRINDHTAGWDEQQMMLVFSFLRWGTLPPISVANVIDSVQRLLELGTLAEELRIPALRRAVIQRIVRHEVLLDLNTFARAAHEMLERAGIGARRAPVEVWTQAYFAVHAGALAERALGPL